jgi:DNA polymerase
VSGDWSNIEGRGQAWFAGEQWKLDAFRAADEKRGPGIYELAYARMFGVPVESVKNPSEERQVGKVSELAFGYQGGVGSFHVMGKTYGVKVSDERADAFKEAWRSAHPRIAGIRTFNPNTGRWYRKGGVWKEIEEAALAAANTPGEIYTCGWPGREAKYRKVGSFLWCLLPSGRAICYPYPKVLEGEFGPQLTYMTQPGPDKSDIIYDPKNASNWARVGTYGGSLFNNIVQGFCRDFLADCMLRLDEAGAAIVLHTHDDVNVEVDEAKGEGARGAMRQMMLTPPAWATGFPLHSKPELMRRYGK